MENLATTLRTAADAVARLGSHSGDIAPLDDVELMAAHEVLGRLQRAIQPYSAWIAAEIARRSRQEFGFGGLAKREGFVDAAALIQSRSGSSRAEAAKLIAVGTMIAEVDDAAMASLAYQGEVASMPWQQPVAAALDDMSMCSAS